MKKIGLCLLILIVLLNSYSILAQPNSKTVFIEGTAIHFNNLIQIQDISEMADLKLPDAERTFLADSNGHFSISFSLDEPNYFRLGRNILFLSPGDSLSAFIDLRWPDSAQFKGKHKNENDYLRYTPYPFAGSFLSSGDSIKASVEATIFHIKSQAEIRKKNLENYVDLSTEFKKLEEARIKADIINSIFYIGLYYPLVHKLTGDSLAAFKAKWKFQLDSNVNMYSKNLMNQDFLKLEVYRRIYFWAMKQIDSTSKEWRQVNDFNIAKEVRHAMNSARDQNQRREFEIELTQVKTDKYRNALRETYNKLVKINGSKASDFVMKDKNDKTIPLSSFAGKIIYLDLWATWCGPCIRNQPYLDSIRHHYKNNSDVVFISLSIDGDLIAWKKHLREKNLSGHQYVIDRLKLDSYFVAEIPRAIIIGKGFTVGAMRAPLPSDKNIKETIDGLLK